MENETKHIGYNVENMTINMSGGTLVQHADLVQAGGEVRVEQAEQTVPETEPFKHLTPQCIADKRAEAVEAEIRAACKGTAEALWRILWDNENLGYVSVEPIDATTLYRDIEKHYGKLPYKERNFRDARSKR